MTLFDQTPKDYRIRFVCDNCKRMTILPIGKGIAIKEFMKLKQGECEFCGSRNLKTVDKRLME